MGCVDEPGLGYTPNVIAFLARWTLDHFTYGEAAWAAQPALSWQTTVIGDPLYSPFSREPAQLHAELQQTHNPLIEWSYLRIVDLSLVRGVPSFQLEDYLENLTNTDSSAVLTEKLADLCDAQGKPDSAIEFYQNALKLHPSPEQRIRIRLALAQEFLAQNQISDAIHDYQELLQESPAWPGKDSISGKIDALLQKISSAK
jgi:tetratricopeptide (TPR) repeat protein